MSGAAAFANSTVQWLAAQPQVVKPLVYIASFELVQELSFQLQGKREVPPEVLIQVLLSVLLAYLIGLLLFPKVRLATWAVWYFWVSSDKKTRKPDPNLVDFKALNCKRMKVVFIRHGESEWNAVFNKGSKLLLPFRLVRALIREAFMFFNQTDSLFIDSPLSDVGTDQAVELLTNLAAEPAGCIKPDSHKLPVAQLEKNDIVAIMSGHAGKSCVVSSILRRAISTGLMSLSPRLLKTDPDMDQVFLMTSLQEISRNIDTLTLTPAHKLPTIPAMEAASKTTGDLMALFYRTRLDKLYNTGNKTLKEKAIKRHEQFTKWVFDQNGVDCVIVCGHSLWFREFFKSYLPKSSTHIGKTTKIVNCGVVAFDLYRDSRVVQIDEHSIKELYGGFEVKGSKKKR